MTDMATLVSVNVGLPRQVSWQGRTLSTGIFKSPVAGSVDLRRLNLEGDRQADLSVHGGPTKAVYAYPTHHYDYWRPVLGEAELDWGSFGENLSVAGIDEQEVYVGDEFRVGSARVVVTEPRLPCFKLAIRLGRADIVKLFLESGRLGFYLGVVQEGAIAAGDSLERVFEHPDRLRIADVARLHTAQTPPEDLLRKAAALEALPESWRQRFQSRLERLRR